MAPVPRVTRPKLKPKKTPANLLFPGAAGKQESHSAKLNHLQRVQTSSTVFSSQVNFQFRGFFHSSLNDNSLFGFTSLNKTVFLKKTNNANQLADIRKKNPHQNQKSISSSDQGRLGKQLIPSGKSHLQVFSFNVAPVTGK